MIDREKVIRAVDACFDYWLVQHEGLYLSELKNVQQLKADTIALLKEQEPISLENQHREKIIAHLDNLRQFADVDVHPAVSPENWHIYATLCDYIDQIREEVETLLKEQEAVEPISRQMSRFNKRLNETIYWCGKCKAPIEKNQSYCGCCGQKVKWDV